MTYPASAEHSGARICVVHCKAETVVHANAPGLKIVGEWIARMGDSHPQDNPHFHVVFHLESEASRFHGALPRNVWSLRHPDAAPYQDQSSGRPELSFRMASEEELNVLSKGQLSGLIPEEWLQMHA